LPFCAVARHASAGAVDLDADADGKILCYAIVAVALDLVWGYAGMLSLGTAFSSPWAAMRWACT
jgi:ABC-type branched-subunit amino acid transport system permease subunit